MSKPGNLLLPMVEENPGEKGDGASRNAEKEIGFLREQNDALKSDILQMAMKQSEMEVKLTSEKEEKLQMLRKVECLEQKLEAGEEEMKSYKLELQHRLEAEKLQREKDQLSHVSMVAELHKIAAEEKEVVQKVKHQLDVELAGFKEQVRELSAMLKNSEKQFNDINMTLEDLKAEVTAEREKNSCSNTDTDELKILPHKDTGKSLDTQDIHCNTVSQDKSPVDRTFFSIDDTRSVESENQLSDILDHFITTTSMHGIGQIIGSKWIVLRIIWIILTLAAVAVLIFHLYSIIDSFRKWPKQTQVTLGLSNPAYPAITVCNENIIRKDALQSMEELKTLRRLLNYINHSILLDNETNISNSGNIGSADLGSTNPLDWLESLGPVFDSLHPTENERKMIEAALNRSTYDGRDTDRDISYLLEEVFQTIYMNVDRDVRFQAGHHISDMLISCTFSGYPCYHQNFTLYQTSSLGNCWTLSSPTMIAKTTGPRAGLSLILYLQNHQFLDGFAQGYGARLAIHAQETKPVPNDDGVLISAASETNIGLSRGTITRIGLMADATVVLGSRKAMDSSIAGRYNASACQIMCIMEDFLSTCDCYGNFYEEFALEVDQSAHVCNTSSERSCLNRKLEKLDEIMKACDCDNPCSETYFYSSVSTRQWPTDSYGHLLLEKVCEKDPDACQKLSKETDSRHLLENFVKINIFFETLNYEEIEEKPLMDLIAIVSPGWVGELHPNSSFYSSLFYGVICNLDCKIQSHFTTYTTARRDNPTDKAVADVWYFRVVMVQVAAVFALVLSMLLMSLELFRKRIRLNKYCFLGIRPVLFAVVGVLELAVIANMWIGYDFNTRLAVQNIFPYSLITYTVSLVLVAFLTSYFTHLLVRTLKFTAEEGNRQIV